MRSRRNCETPAYRKFLGGDVLLRPCGCGGIGDAYDRLTSTFLFDTHLNLNAIDHGCDMSDDADFLAPAVKCLESIDGDVKGVGIKSPETFVNKKSIDKRGSAFETG